MADGQEDVDKTEEPTERRIAKAIAKGDVAKSTEVNTWFMLAGLCLGIAALSGGACRDLALALKAQLMNAHLVPADAGGLARAGRQGLVAGFAALALPLGLLLLAAFGGSLVQHAPLWTHEPLLPQLSRLSPAAGFKRIFGREALAQFLKGLAKIGAVGTAGTIVLWGQRDRVDVLARLDVAALLPAARAMVVELLGSMLAILAFLAVGDYFYQRVTWLRRQRMSKQELKEEFKETEGNPEIKSRFKQIRNARTRRRMMAAVPKATVIVANPSHYAVALSYETGMAAPLCVAKGVDALALRIRALAEESGVPVVESPQLARALHATVAIDEEIPVEHYKAVAEVIGYVLRLRGRAA